MITNTPRTWVLGTAVIAALVVVAGWFSLIVPARAHVQELRAEAVTARASTAQLAAGVAALRQEFVTLPDKQRALQALQSALPATLDLSALTRTIQGRADADGITLMSIAPGTPAMAGASAGSADTSQAASAADPNPGAAVSTALTLQVVGSLAQTQVFLEDLQSMDRDVLVTGVSATATGAASGDASTPATRDGDLKTTITGQVFVLPDVDTPTPQP